MEFKRSLGFDNLPLRSELPILSSSPFGNKLVGPCIYQQIAELQWQFEVLFIFLNKNVFRRGAAVETGCSSFVSANNSSSLKY